MSKFDIKFDRSSSSAIDDFFAKNQSSTLKTASTRVRVASLHVLAGFERVSSDTLVRISQNDFWRLGQDDEGFFIERLVDDSKSPVNG